MQPPRKAKTANDLLEFGTRELNFAGAERASRVMRGLIFQISNFRFQISDFKSQNLDSNFDSQISDLKSSDYKSRGGGKMRLARIGGGNNCADGFLIESLEPAMAL